MATSAFQQGLEVLEPSLDTGSEKGVVVIGTVQGNVQESGTLLIGAMLRGAGFTVHNLGVNVTAERFVEEAFAQGASVVAIGVYTRDRLPNVEEVARLARSSGLHTLVGGKGISLKQAILAGADAYAEDGYEAIQRALELSNGRPNA